MNLMLDLNMECGLSHDHKVLLKDCDAIFSKLGIDANSRDFAHEALLESDGITIGEHPLKSVGDRAVELMLKFLADYVGRTTTLKMIVVRVNTSPFGDLYYRFRIEIPNAKAGEMNEMDFGDDIQVHCPITNINHKNDFLTLINNNKR